MARYRVDGFSFETEEEARQAQKELDGIAYIRTQTKMNDPDVIFTLYNRLVEQQIFETAVGIEFMRELQNYLESVPYIKKEDIVPIPVPDKGLDEERRLKEEQRAARRQQKLQQRAGSEQVYRKRYRITGALCAVLAAIVVGMFAITYISGNSTNIFNYEQKIIDKYEAWEQELSQREADVLRREQILQNQMNP